MSAQDRTSRVYREFCVLRTTYALAPTVTNSKQLMFRLAKRIADGSKADIRTVFLIFDGNHISNFRKQNLPQYTCLHYAFPC